MYAPKLFTTVTSILLLLNFAGVNAQSCVTDDDGPGDFICCERSIDSDDPNAKTDAALQLSTSPVLDLQSLES
ncbi:hypothetical protein K435DRAFT_780823, partial [Dendrothele bispora CBS 962.96]